MVHLCVIAFVIFGMFAWFGFEWPSHFEKALRNIGFAVTFLISALVTEYQDATFSTQIFGQSVLLTLVFSWLPYLGHKLGSYLGDRYEGRRI